MGGACRAPLRTCACPTRIDVVGIFPARAARPSASSAPSSPSSTTTEPKDGRYLGLDILAKSRHTKITIDTPKAIYDTRRTHGMECQQRITPTWARPHRRSS